MKKFTITFLCLIASYSFTQARIFHVGPRIGASTSQIKIEGRVDRFTDSSFAWGYQAGVVARLHLPILYLQPELLITSSGGKCSWQALNLKYIKLELPVMVGISLLDLLRIQAGPTASLLLSAHEGHRGIRENYEHWSLGYQVGLGVDIWRVMIDLKYEGSLTQFGHKLAGIEAVHRPRLFILGIGFSIL